MKMNDDTASFIANCYEAAKLEDPASDDLAHRKLTIVRAAINMGLTITSDDIDAALDYCKKNPLGSAAPKKVYLGDGAYASYDGWQIIVTTENGYQTTNTIALEPSVYDALVEYATQLGIDRRSPPSSA